MLLWRCCLGAIDDYLLLLHSSFLLGASSVDLVGTSSVYIQDTVPLITVSQYNT